VGKVMTLPKGARMRNLNLNEVIQGLEAHGYTVIGKPQEEQI